MCEAQVAQYVCLTVTMKVHDGMGVVELPVHLPASPRLHEMDPNNSGKCRNCSVPIQPGSATPYCASPYSDLPA